MEFQECSQEVSREEPPRSESIELWMLDTVPVAEFRAGLDCAVETIGAVHVGAFSLSGFRDHFE